MSLIVLPPGGLVAWFKATQEVAKDKEIGLWSWNLREVFGSCRWRYRRKRKRLYSRNGFGVYSNANSDGRLIVTEDGSGKGLNSKAIQELAERLFVR